MLTEQHPARADLLAQYLSHKGRNLALLRTLSSLAAQLLTAQHERDALEADLQQRIARPQPPPSAPAAPGEPAGPQLYFEAGDTLHRFRKYSLRLDAPRGWLRSIGLAPLTLLRAGARAVCALERSPERTMRGCAVCGARQIVEVGVRSPTDFLPRAGGACESVVWDACKVFCSSSKNHHGSRFVVTMDIPGHGRLVSRPFHTQSRKKKSSEKEPVAAAAAAAAAAVPVAPTPPEAIAGSGAAQAPRALQVTCRVFAMGPNEAENAIIRAHTTTALMSVRGVRAVRFLRLGGLMHVLLTFSEDAVAVMGFDHAYIRQANPLGIDLSQFIATEMTSPDAKCSMIRELRGAVVRQYLCMCPHGASR
eukprot:m51a1_g1855 hypothetical protein (364) ;mRNA; f:605290-606985